MHYPQYYSTSTELFFLASWHELRLRSRSVCSVFIKASWTRLSLPGRDLTRPSLRRPVRVTFTWFSDCRRRGRVSSVGLEVVRSSWGSLPWSCTVGTWLVEDVCKCRRSGIPGLAFLDAFVFVFVFLLGCSSGCTDMVNYSGLGRDRLYKDTPHDVWLASLPPIRYFRSKRLKIIVVK